MVLLVMEMMVEPLQPVDTEHLAVVVLVLLVLLAGVHHLVQVAMVKHSLHSLPQ